MSIIKESYYKLVKISELSTLNRNTFVQIIGKIILYDEPNQKVQVNDTFGTYTLELGKIKDFILTEGSVIRVFGVWDGIKMTLEKILDWNIDPKTIPLLF